MLAEFELKAAESADGGAQLLDRLEALDPKQLLQLAGPDRALVRTSAGRRATGRRTTSLRAAGLDALSKAPPLPSEHLGAGRCRSLVLAHEGGSPPTRCLALASDETRASDPLRVHLRRMDARTLALVGFRSPS
jgi:hypothetical protein